MKGKIYMFFRKKYKGSISLTLSEDQFCTVWEGKQKDCAYNFEISTSADQYNLVYQDGKFLGLPLTNGGSIHPFSFNPAKQGSRKDKKKFKSAKIVCVSSAFNLSMNWGVPEFLMFDEAGKAYDIGASGVFYVEIDPSDAGRNADTFYRKLLTHGDPSRMNTKALRDKLLPAFQNVIGSAIEEVIAGLDRPLSALVGLAPKEKIAISNAVYYKVKDVFASFGLTIVKITSMNSIVGNLVIKEHR